MVYLVVSQQHRVHRSKFSASRLEDFWLIASGHDFQVQPPDLCHYIQVSGGRTFQQCQGSQICNILTYGHTVYDGFKWTYLPPRKCLPRKKEISGFGAVKLTSAAGWKFFPGPDFGGPVSIFHEEGASTEVTGTVLISKASMTAENGSLTSPEKLNPGSNTQMHVWENRDWQWLTEYGINNMISFLYGR